MSPFTRINQSRSPLLHIAVGALLLTLIVGAGLAIMNRKTVTVVVDGEKLFQTTMSPDVRGVLKAAGFAVTERDKVPPPWPRASPTAPPSRSTARAKSLCPWTG